MKPFLRPMDNQQLTMSIDKFSVYLSHCCRFCPALIILNLDEGSFYLARTVWEFITYHAWSICITYKPSWSHEAAPSIFFLPKGLHWMGQAEFRAGKCVWHWPQPMSAVDPHIFLHRWSPPWWPASSASSPCSWHSDPSLGMNSTVSVNIVRYHTSK
jgi:hypothetical protein